LFTPRHPFLLVAVLLAAMAAWPVRAAERMSFIRDTEVENTIRAFATPLFEAAGLNPTAVELHIVNDKSLNAFVAGGMKMFLHTGLLIRAESASQVIGVIAHETGHISGGHLSRAHDALANASSQALIATVVGAATAIATGRPDAGAAVAAGGQNIAIKNLLSFSRGQESSADQAGILFLERTGQSAKGMLEFLQILSGQELMVIERQDPYVRTHPITAERVDFVRDQVSKSRYSNVTVRPELEVMHRRMRAKLFAFLEPPARTLSRYKANDTTLDARMARAIAYYRKPDMANALPLIDGLIAEFPNDPYLHELKGQFLFENGRPAESVIAYREAVRLYPEAPLLRIGLAQVELELGDDSLLPQAQANLVQALRSERENPFAWRQLAIAYGRAGNEPYTAYAMAEYAIRTGSLSEASYHVDRADKLLPKNSPAWIAVQDMKQAIDRAKRKQN